MKLVVCGSRRLTDRHYAWSALGALHEKRKFSLLVHGFLPGAEGLAVDWAVRSRVKIRGHVVGSEEHGAAARAVWCREVLERGELRPDLVIAFPGERDSLVMVMLAHLAKVPVVKVPASTRVLHP